ncbi:MAG: hypothetical protein WCD49_12380 [Candidatus Acidiferrales bacterium]
MEKTPIDEDGDTLLFDDKIWFAYDVSRLAAPTMNSVCLEQSRKTLFRALIPRGSNGPHVFAAARVWSSKSGQTLAGTLFHGNSVAKK